MIDGMRMQFEVQSCPDCGVRFGVPDGFTANRRKDKRAFHCPNGHSMSYTESEADKLRRERDRLKQDAAWLNDRIAEKDREIAAAKGQVTKLKNRIAAGACPCCNRNFVNLQRHMKTKHPDFKTAEVVPLKSA